ncbi:MAG TPA: ribosome biogenesis factor YjgA [Polyangiaceae bacterium]|nr:ribosome biogenesis factor YjgA [Polyangiaceae bacterium]
MSSRIVDPRIEAEAFAGESRGDARRAERVKEDALARLATDLCKLSAKKLGQLELPEELADAVTDARAMTSAPAKNRQIRRIRILLRDQEWMKLRGQLDTLLETGVVPGLGAAPADVASDRSLSWTLRLVGEGNDGLEAFLAEFPRADRTHLRQLVRAVQKAVGDRRLRAERTLTAALRGFLR